MNGSSRPLVVWASVCDRTPSERVFSFSRARSPPPPPSVDEPRSIRAPSPAFLNGPGRPVLARPCGLITFPSHTPLRLTNRHRHYGFGIDQWHGGRSPGRRPRGRQSDRLLSLESDSSFYHPGKLPPGASNEGPCYLSPGPSGDTSVCCFVSRPDHVTRVSAGPAPWSGSISALTIATGRHRPSSSSYFVNYCIVSARLGSNACGRCVWLTDWCRSPPAAEPTPCHRRGHRRHFAGTYGDDADTGIQRQYVSLADCEVPTSV